MPKHVRVSWKKFERFILGLGCVYARTKGDHRIYRRSDLTRPIVIPRHDPLSPGMIENNLRTLGITKVEFEKMIRKL